MRKHKLKIIIICYFFLITGCQTVKEKTNSVIEKENKLYQINKIKKMKSYVYELVLTTGKKREIREIFQYNKVAINRLKRVQMGEYSLENMQPGDIKELDLS